MDRLTHKRENGIKHGCWSPNKKQELVDRLAMYENREELLMSELEKEADKANDMISVCERELCQYYDGFEDGVSKAIEIVKGGMEDAEDAKDTNVPGKWIPCSERLPKKPEIYGDSDGYIVQTRRVEQPFIGYWDGREWADEEVDVVDEVIAWMPLPEPYREVE